MYTHRLIILVLTSLVVCACRTPGMALSSTGTGSEPVAVVIGSTTIVDDFESSTTRWIAGTWPDFVDSSAVRATTSSDHVTRGSRSLQLAFDLLNLPKAIFYLNRELDLSSSQAVAFDLFNAGGAAQSVAIALRTGDAWTWQESLPIDLKPGANVVVLDLSGAKFKTAAMRWQHRTIPGGLSTVHQLAVIIYPNRTGSVFIDKLLTLHSPAVQSSPASPSATGVSPHIVLRARQLQIGQYGRLELDIDTDVKVDNPFDPDQIAIDVQFDGPAGERIRVPAFYFQDFKPGTREPVWPQTWKALFTPSTEGKWSARARLKTAKADVVSQPISFDVAPAVARGFVRTSASNPLYLAFDNGEAFFPIGLNLGWGHADPLQDYQRWFDALKQNGANVTRIWMASWAFGIEWNDSGLGHYRLDRAWLLDQVMQMAEERGIYVILVLINHGAFNIRVNPEWASNPYNAELGGPCQTPEDFATNPQARKLFKQRLRYIAARWSYSPSLLAWEWWNEVNLTPLSDPNLLRPWLQEMTPYLHSVDPYHHLTSISYSDSSDPRIVNMRELDTMQHHSYSSFDPRISMPAAYNDFTAYGTQTITKPILYTEFGASSSGEQPNRFDSEGIQFHNALWASTFTGFSTAAMYWWWDSYIEPNNYWYHLKGLSRFLATEDVSSLSPAVTQVNTTTIQVSALTAGDHALLWVRNAQYSVDSAESNYRQATLFDGVKEADWHFVLQERRNATVTLAGMRVGTYHVTWFDTRTGDLLAEATIHSRDGNVTVATPSFQRDLAAKIMLISR